MSNLLQLSRMKSSAMERNKKALPLYMEYKVNPEMAPYLVSSSNAVMWIEEAFEGGLVRTAVRKVTPGQVFWEAVKAVIVRGRESQWGNIHPFTPEGLAAAIEHVDEYDMGDLEVLMAPYVVPTPKAKMTASKKTKVPVIGSLPVPPEVAAAPVAQRPSWTLTQNIGLPVRPTNWLPQGTAVIVPADREYVGLLGHLTSKDVVMLVHNAGRAMGIITDL